MHLKNYTFILLKAEELFVLLLQNIITKNYHELLSKSIPMEVKVQIRNPEIAKTDTWLIT